MPCDIRSGMFFNQSMSLLANKHFQIVGHCSPRFLAEGCRGTQRVLVLILITAKLVVEVVLHIEVAEIKHRGLAINRFVMMLVMMLINVVMVY